ncbi:hypothetical protein [Pyrinomonas methylaliphatogenes]|jgi:hypothetical protein|uniref:Uncharacterized protein n=1 Tax=Pyrinomonas methylaliphatogenes TaxID=454194 RepID=A0A0B6WZ63_9BACT|nr:hypothetical protein [Pyrinomonas methylaliphatogenes]MBX5478088.1 hypothetical protein [Pyrinomonas methylaliphatogenes]CDM66401.1 hypothetical protein PYK22_02431 [Pyrinomonas methylaliphatogenes]
MAAKKEPVEFKAKLTNDGGIVRGKIPAPLVSYLGGRAGDYLVFRADETGRVVVSLRRTHGAAKKVAKGGAK